MKKKRDGNLNEIHVRLTRHQVSVCVCVCVCVSLRYPSASLMIPFVDADAVYGEDYRLVMHDCLPTINH